MGDGVASFVTEPRALSALAGAVDLATNDGLTCACMPDGKVRCVGRGAAAFEIFSGCRAIAVGRNEVCALDAGGRAQCAVSEKGGIALRSVPGIDGATSLSFDLAACALKDGVARCWAPTFGAEIHEAPVADLRRLSVGDGLVCGVRDNGEVMCWKNGIITAMTSPRPRYPKPRRVAEHAIDVHAGRDHACAVLDGGRVSCWGDDRYGQLGDGVRGARDEGAVVAGLAEVVEVATGWQHSCARTRAGEIYCWGASFAGQSGAEQEVVSRPTKLAGVTDAVRLVAGAVTTCFQRRDGEVRCFGSGESGQLADEAMEPPSIARPTLVAGVRDAVFVAAGAANSCAFNRAGEITCWGKALEPHSRWVITPRNGVGREVWASGCAPFREGRPIAERAAKFSVAVPGIVALELHAARSCAQTADARVCWDAPCSGCGDEPGPRQRPTPVREPAAPLPPELIAAGISDVTQVVRGAKHTCALRSTGSVLCFGDDSNGQLGDGGRRSRDVPIVVRGLDDIVQIVAGVGHTCARRRDGGIACWGANALGQLGDGTTRLRRRPTVIGVRDASDLIAGPTYTCAIAERGVLCWGDDGDGQLGDGGGPSRPRPLAVRLP